MLHPGVRFFELLMRIFRSASKGSVRERHVVDLFQLDSIDSLFFRPPLRFNPLQQSPAETKNQKQNNRFFIMDEGENLGGTVTTVWRSAGVGRITFFILPFFNFR